MTILAFPTRPPATELDDAPNGSLATWDSRLYARGGLGWICLNGSVRADRYAHWLPTLPDTAVLIREGL